MTASGRFVYPMTLAALPRHGDLLSAKRPPVSRLGLERRLALLPAADRAEIDAIEGVLRWDRTHAAKTDAAAVARAQATLASIRTQFVRDIVADRLHLRAILAALRRRGTGVGPPPLSELSLSPHAWRVVRRWREPGFGLGPQERWVRRVEAAMAAGDPLAAEREILVEAWRRLGRARPADPLGYEAIVVYVLRWSLIDRWTRYDGPAARDRFDAWIETAIAEAS